MVAARRRRNQFLFWSCADGRGRSPNVAFLFASFRAATATVVDLATNERSIPMVVKVLRQRNQIGQITHVTEPRRETVHAVEVGLRPVISEVRLGLHNGAGSARW